MTLTVRPVRSRRDRRQFLRLADAVFGADPMWTPALEQDLERALSESNPLWQNGRGERELLIAYEGDKPVGRILAHEHRASNERHHERAGFFGLLACPDDEAIAKALIDAAAEHHRARGLNVLRGPYELNISQCIGAVVDGFDEPASFSQSWSPPHVAKLLERLDFKVVYRAATFRLDDVMTVDAAALIGPKQRAWLDDPAVRVRPFNLDRFEEDLRAATKLLNESFASNFGFVPLSDEEIAFMAGPMKRVVRPELTVFLERAGEPAGVGMLLPDFNVLFRRMGGSLWPLGWAQFLLGTRRLDSAVVQFIATTPALQNQGLMRVIVSKLLEALQRNGFRTLDATWIGESNAGSRAQVRAVGMREKHQLALYERPL